MMCHIQTDLPLAIRHLAGLESLEKVSLPFWISLN